MIKLLFLIIIMTFTSQAFATHAYRDLSCRSETHTLNYKSSYPIGGVYGLSKIDSDDEVDLWEIFDDGMTGEPDDDNYFEVIHLETLSSDTVKAACNPGVSVTFDKTSSKNTYKIKFATLANSDEEKSGIKTGSLMTFECDETLFEPAYCQ